MDILAQFDPGKLSFFIGGVIVFLVTMTRFSHPVRLPQALPENVPGWLGAALNMFRRNPNPVAPICRPTRANTTLFRYRLYQLFYAVIALIVYWLLVERPELRQQTSQIVVVITKAMTGEDTGIPFLEESAPLLIAAFVTLVLPYVPVLKGADEAVRRWLYTRASIPAQQLRELNRLKRARYVPPEGAVEIARRELVTEGFMFHDIDYNPDVPTTQSLWTKCVLLMYEVNRLQADDRYKAAFSELFEPEKDERFVDVITARYKALSIEAKSCFAALRVAGADVDESVAQLQETFRAHCKAFLDLLYRLTSGISLLAHYSDGDRIREMSRLGFKLEQGNSSPVPGPNEVLALVIILGTVIVLPLSTRMGMARALFVGSMMMTAVLVPIFLARVFPKLTHRGETHAPPIAFPVIAGVVAAAAGALIMVLMNFVQPQTYCGAGAFGQYLNCAYPWSLPHGAVAALVAWRMQTGSYPDVRALAGFKRYRIWGSFLDSAVFVVVMLAVTYFALVPMLATIRADVVVQRVPATEQAAQAILTPIVASNVNARLTVSFVDGNQGKLFRGIVNREAGSDVMTKIIERLGTANGRLTRYSFTVLRSNNDLARVAPMLTRAAAAIDGSVVDVIRPFEGSSGVGLLLRLGLMAAAIGFVVPTWYRAQVARRTGERRRDFRRREKFDAMMKDAQHYEAAR